MKKYKGLGYYNLTTEDLKQIKMKKNKNPLTRKLTGEDLRQIANFHAIVRNYIKMSRLLKEINQ